MVSKGLVILLFSLFAASLAVRKCILLLVLVEIGGQESVSILPTGIKC